MINTNLKLIFSCVISVMATGCATKTLPIPQLEEECIVTSDNRVYAEFRLANNGTIPQKMWVDWGIYNEDGIQNLISEPLEQTLHAIKSPAWPDPGLMDVELSYHNTKWIDIFWNNRNIKDDEVFGMRLRLEFLVSGADSSEILFSDLFELGSNSKLESCPPSITPQIFFGSGCANTPADPCVNSGSGTVGGQ